MSSKFFYVPIPREVSLDGPRAFQRRALNFSAHVYAEIKRDSRSSLTDAIQRRIYGKGVLHRNKRGKIQKVSKLIDQGPHNFISEPYTLSLP